MRAEAPHLKTLPTRPSWHNRAGRVDRSACFSLTAAKLWRLIDEASWSYTFAARQYTRHAKGRCDRHAEITLTARDLWLLHKRETPQRIDGDRRTTKSNAMRGGGRGTGAGVQQGIRAQTPTPNAAPCTPHPAINPNRGAGFAMGLKRLGLDCMWDTTLMIQRIVQHDKLKQHFIVCPACRPRNDGSGGMDIPVCRSAQPNRNAPRGTSPPANKLRSKLPPGLATKLYLPLCTEQEYEDAQRARLWLTTHTDPNRPLSPGAAQLIKRYGELFQDPASRQLRCRHCLGLRYGQAKH